MKAMFISAALLASAAAYAADVKKVDSKEQKADNKGIEKPPPEAFGATNPKADVNPVYERTYNEKYGTAEEKAEAKKARLKDEGRKDKDGAVADKKSDDVKPVQSDYSQSELLDKLHKVAVGHTEMGNLAQTRGANDKVKRLGQKIAKEFVNLDQQFIGYAKENDIVLSDATGMFRGADKKGAANKSESMDRLGKLQGEGFDRAFLTATVDGCEKFIPILEGAKGKFEDGKFDRVIGKAIDTLKTYQKEAAKLQQDYAPAS